MALAWDMTMVVIVIMIINCSTCRRSHLLADLKRAAGSECVKPLVYAGSPAFLGGPVGNKLV